MKKQVINGFPISFTHTTPTDQNNITFLQIVRFQYLLQSHSPNKERNTRWDSGFPNAFPPKLAIMFRG
jgi:hypothetical protein